MDSFRFNQMAMIFLGTVFFIFSLSILSDALFHSEKPEKEGYAIAAAEGDHSADKPKESGPGYDPVEPLLASADLDAGASVFKKCASCHTFEKGGAAKVGPNLYNIVGGPIAANASYGKYSSALKEYGEGKTWTFEELNGFLFKPKAHVKGTAMGFAGIKKTADRANLIGWLRQHADSPAALPEG